MKHSKTSDAKVKILALLGQLKRVASAEYALSDLHPANLWILFKPIFMNQGLGSGVRKDSQDWHTFLKQLADQYQRYLIWIGITVAGLTLTLNVLLPLKVRVQDHLLLRPTQWAYLQNLTKELQLDSKSSERVVNFDDTELQKLRTLLLNRGIKPSILSFSAGAIPSIEFQADEMMFSTLLELLDEMRSVWHLYPSELIVRRTDSAGVVNVSSHFLQYQAGGVESVTGVLVK